jgi:hypothetical protein
MFPARFFGPRYFAAVYFAEVGAVSLPAHLTLALLGVGA